MSVIIGIPSVVDGEKNSSMLSTYAYAIEKAGGLPILLPYVADKELISRFSGLCDGFFFMGGADIEPSVYGEEKRETCDKTEPFHDELELALFDAALGTGKPILGICRGAQLINAALGGTLYQDIPTETDATLNHRQTEDKFEFSHDIVIKKNSPLYTLVKKDRVRGNSFHHQAIKKLADSLSVMAVADDGIIEGFYHRTHPYLRAYQWHPERLFDKDEASRLIFVDFINACNKKSRYKQEADG